MSAGPAARRRGQPLLALALVLVGWITGRALTLQDYPLNGPPAHPASVPPLRHQPSLARQILPLPLRRPHPHISSLAPQRTSAPPAATSTPWPPIPSPAPVPFLLPPLAPLPPRNAALIPPIASTPSQSADPQEFYEPLVAKDDPRWSGENWLLMRAGSGSAAQAPGAASYGASQAGAIVRYRFGKGEPQDSYGYLRTSLAINAPGKDKEVALGLGIRPVRRLPVRALVEARLQDTSRSPMQVRPVATLITELPWQRLPRGFRLEAYGQAGYAGGKAATAFFDAQALLDHPVRGVVSRNGDLRAGVGMWSGGQEGAVRLDVGPRVAFRLEGGRLFGPTRVALDWRLRIAGNARPGSGPTMTVTSAF